VQAILIHLKKINKKSMKQLYIIPSNFERIIQKLGWAKNWSELGVFSYLIYPLQPTQIGINKGFVKYKDGINFSLLGQNLNQLYLTKKGKKELVKCLQTLHKR
jgi:hypothetical protein